MNPPPELNHRDRCAIVGIGRTEYSRNSGRSALTLASEAVRSALADCGLTVADVDGLVRSDFDKVQAFSLAGALGAKNVGFWGDSGPGGCGPAMMLGLAIGAILSGQATTVVVYRSLNGRSGGARLGQGNRRTGGGGETADEYFIPHGLLAAGHIFSLMTQRCMIERGLKPEHLAQIAVTQREHAQHAPHAVMHGKPLDMEGYYAARMLSTPLRLNDYCLETDGAAAFVVTSAERARDLPKKPVLVRAVAAAMPTDVRPGMLFSTSVRDDLTELPAWQVAPRLWQRAGMGPGDIDIAQIYDCFTISVLLQLEAFGFCRRGEAGDFAMAGHLGRNGRLPNNTAGGNLSEGYIHGVNHFVEAVRQLRGEADMQIPEARTCLVTSGPVPLESAAILRTD